MVMVAWQDARMNVNALACTQAHPCERHILYPKFWNVDVDAGIVNTCRRRIPDANREQRGPDTAVAAHEKRKPGLKTLLESSNLGLKFIHSLSLVPPQDIGRPENSQDRKKGKQRPQPLIREIQSSERKRNR